MNSLGTNTTTSVESHSDIRLYSASRIALYSCIVVLVCLFGYITLSILISVQNTSDRLLSCTDPKGACYQSGDRRSGAAVKLITDTQRHIVVISAYCAKVPENKTLDQIESCVNKELAK